MTLPTYDEALSLVTDRGPISVLLGNGFSRACRDNIFNYANLYESAEFGEREHVLRALFRAFDTYDFEAVARSLTTASTVVRAYFPESPLLDELQQDLGKLKEALIDVISRTHPGRPDLISVNEYLSARIFLSRFDQIFTLNYDFLLYWARLRETPGQAWRTDDGFRFGRWIDGNTKQNVHFLHGALHIIDGQIHIDKLHYAERYPLINQVRESLEEGKFPLFVSEPSAKKKLQKIVRNPYLKACYTALGKIRGTLVILGHSLDDNDSHIFEKIRGSAVSSVLVSIYGDENSDSNRRVKANATAFMGKQECDVSFFDASTANPWQSFRPDIAGRTA